MTWPTLPAFSANSFLDHFAGSSLNARWTAVTSGTGAVSVTDSYADISSPAASAAFIYLNTQLDKTKSQLWMAAVNVASSNLASDFGPPLFHLLNGASAPAADTHTNIVARNIVRNDIGVQGSTQTSFAWKWSNTGSQIPWNGLTASPSWGSFDATSGMQQPVAFDDYYVIGLEIDGVNGRWRVLGWHQSFATAGTYTWLQGYRMFALTDWTTWANTRDSSNLWLVFGRPFDDGADLAEFKVEWVRYSEAPAGNTVLDWWGNQGGEPGSGGDQGIRHQYSYDGVIFLPEDRATQALSLGATYDSNEMSCPSVATDGTDDYMFYSGEDTSFAANVCVASATHVASNQQGPWTKYASNPIITAPTGESNIQFPWAFQDLADSDSNKRWKLLLSSKRTSDSKWRQRLYTAPAATGPWTDQGVIIDVGTAGAFDETAARDGVPLYFNGQWELWYEGWDANGYVGIGRATGASLTSLTKDGVGARIGYTTTPDTTVAATFAGRTVTVASTAGFVQDGYVWISSGVDNQTYLTSRVRKVVDGTTLELYHGVTTSSGWTFPVRIAQVDSSRHFSPRWIGQVGTEWWFIVNQWFPFLTYENAYVIIDQAGGLFTHSNAAPSGATPVRNDLAWPSPSRGFNTPVDSTTVENGTLVNQPFSLPAATIIRTIGSRSRAGSRSVPC